jgi:chemotaxis protein methyltransferase CheR
MERLRKLIEAETGMDLSGDRISRLQDAVERVLSTKNSVQRLEQILTDPDHGVFLEHLVAELTVGETFFFRNEHHFRALAEHVIPQILHENDAQKEIRIWAAGCSTGEEPYSLAILLDQILVDGETKSASDPGTSPTASRLSPWHVSIFATDLNPEFLERARHGLYREWSFRGTDIHQDRRYFACEGNGYRLLPRIRERVRFAYMNLVKDVYPSPLNATLGLDLIVFRNVAIYLKPEVVNAIIDRFHRALRPGGWLLLGETELNVAGTHQFATQRLGRAVFYQKKHGTPTPDAQSAMMPASVLTGPWQRPGTTSLAEWDTNQQALLEASSANKGSSKTPSLWERIERHLNREEFAAAERVLEDVSARRERAVARLRYVLHLMSYAENDRAREMLEKCLSEEPLQIEAYLLKASLAEEAGNLAEAERAYRRALYLDRRCAIAHFHLAFVQEEQGDLQGSKRSLKTVLELTQNHDPDKLVEHSDGVCYGRLREMAEMVLGF